MSPTLSIDERLEDTSADEKSLPDFMRLSAQWALEKLEDLNLEEKIAQSFMLEVTPNKGEEHIKEIDSLISHYKVGGLITFQGDVEQTKSTLNYLQSKSIIPLLVGIDGEWGSQMRLKDGERFPFQLTMGAANQLESTRVIGQAMGEELRELGIHMNFSPVVDVNTNPNNPVIGFRSFGENPLLVSRHAVALIKGMQEYRILTSMKHFPGHGDTDVDSHFDLPTINKTKEELNRIDWLPYRQGRLAGASSVMVGHLNVPTLDSSGTPSSLSSIIIQDILRDKLRFQGLIISDALNMKALTDRYGDVDIVKKAYLAGNDILLYPSKIKESILAIREAVEQGEITIQEVNDKALRVLRAKYYAIIADGALEVPKLSKEKVEYAKMNIYEKSLVVVKNEDAIPVKNVSGNNLILSIGGDGSAFHESASNYTHADTLFAQTADEAWELYGDILMNYHHIYINLIAPSVLPRNNYSYPKGWKEFLAKLPTEPHIYVSFFGNPYAVSDSNDFDKVDVVILGFQNTAIGQNRAAQLIFGGFQATSVLPITLSVDYQEGFGLITEPASRLKFTVPMELGIESNALQAIDSILLHGIEEGAFPGGQVVVAKDGKVIYQKAFGYHTYEKKQAVDNKTIYDLASITKIASATTGLMHLQDENRFSLDSTLGTYLSNITKGTVYNNLKMKEVMSHQAGLVPWIPFYTQTLINNQPNPELYSSVAKDHKTSIVANNLYLDSTYEDSIIRQILMRPLRAKGTYRYSDLGYYFVKKIIEQITDQPLNEYMYKAFYEPMGLTTMGYLPLERFGLTQIAPTEEDSYFRHQTIHGYVHDMGAAMTGGVGGHAGLFSNATDVAGFMQMLLNGGVYGGKRYLSKKVIKEYTSCQYCPKNRRGAGFDKPITSGTGGPSSNLASKKSFGHTGFTGTIAWADPENNINYVFLSNRTYPDAENWKLVQMNIRTEIQEVIYKVLK